MALHKINHSKPEPLDQPTFDQACTMFFSVHAKCHVCGKVMRNGDDAWSYVLGGAEVLTHHDCIKRHALGIAKDMLAVL